MSELEKEITLEEETPVIRSRFDQEVNPKAKQRTWWVVMYPENMVDNWQDVIDELIPLPLCYVVHDKDHLAPRNDDIDQCENHDERKIHVHIMVHFPGPTTYNHVCKNIFACLNKPGKKAFNTCFPVNFIRSAYEYLIHADSKSVKKGKFLYPKADRIELNNFDIGAYEQLTTEQIDAALLELADVIIKRGISDFIEIHMMVTTEYNSDPVYFHVLKAHQSYLYKLARDNFVRASKASFDRYTASLSDAEFEEHKRQLIAYGRTFDLSRAVAICECAKANKFS